MPARLQVAEPGVYPATARKRSEPAQILRSLDEAPRFRIKKGGVMRFRQKREKARFFGGPLVGIARALGYPPGNLSPGNSARRLHSIARS